MDSPQRAVDSRCAERATALERPPTCSRARCEADGAPRARAGKTLPDALGEVREAADFCRYYAMLARRHFAAARGIARAHGGIEPPAARRARPFVCISPWNFPLAIFVGQVAAAYAAGNAVVAKPASRPRSPPAAPIALMHEAGIPHAACTSSPGSGETVGAALVSASGDGGRRLHRLHRDRARHQPRARRARRPARAVHRGDRGPERDAGRFERARRASGRGRDRFGLQQRGQRCSALRILCLQEEIAPRVIELLAGATAELRVGDPARLETDVGPVIDREALAMLEEHAARMDREAKLLCKAGFPRGSKAGSSSRRAPTRSLRSMPSTARSSARSCTSCASVRTSSRDGRAHQREGLRAHHGRSQPHRGHRGAVRVRARAGNLYVNRNMIGATVGVQPFGGEGLSGTGPKAGGPHYLFRFATERTFTVNTAAAGGNASLIAGSE
jgi:RHH-type proline utilization regulon transcriptional repressor/proline dehydrogenase/delta 1-pyrroline-5-carboxylate dehydrogenase